MRFITLIAMSVLLAACSSAPKKADPIAGALAAVEVKAPIELKLKGDPDRKDLVMYLSRTRSENIHNGQTAKESVDETRFVTESSMVASGENFISMQITTVDKEGKLDLNQIAMPEFAKVLKLILRTNGQVIEASNVPKNSIYYVSPVSLPSTPVSIGDTWVSRESWISQNDQTPMVMESVSILRSVVTCGSDQCADIEMSGDVDVQGGLQSVNFKSHWSGRMLFAINAGTVVWSRSDSLETLQAENAGTRVQSCLESVLVKPEALKLAHMSTPKCDPEATPAVVKP